MTKRNLTLLIILLLIIALVVFSYFFFNKPKTPDNTSNDSSAGTNFFSSLLNFGKSKTNTNNNTEGNGEEDPANISGYEGANTEIPLKTMKLTKISSMPVAGFSVFEQERYQTVPDVTPDPLADANTPPVIPTAPPTEFVSVLRYVAIATGNIYQTYVDTISEKKFTDTVIPIVPEAFFGNNGGTVIMRYLKTDNKTIATFTGALPKEVLGGDTIINQGELSGSFLPENISDMSVSPDSSQIFYLFNNTNNKAQGFTALAIGSNKTQVFDSGYTEWLSQWPNNNLITVTTKPSYATPGYMYSINPNKKDFKKVLGKINGLTTLTSPNGQLVLYTSNNLSLNIYNIETGATGSIPIKTLPEKCVWGNNNDVLYCAVPKFVNTAFQYPDSWYQGKILFSDDIWRIDVASGTGSKILDPLLSELDSSFKENAEPIDGIKLALDKNEDTLFLINKVDSFLWGLKLK